jgi:hypothetical protein
MPYKTLLYLFIRGFVAGEFAFVELPLYSEILLINNVAENMPICLYSTF